MADTVVFNAETRERTGKGGARTLRRAGKLPAIIYGGTEEPVKIALTLREVKRQLDMNPRFLSSVCELDLGSKRIHVLPREVQLHPVHDLPIHVDFMRAEGGTMVSVAVAAHFVNEQASPGLRRGGVLNIVRREIELVCPADAIPEEITVDLSGFDIGDSIHISHVKLPDRILPEITDRDFTIASIVPPTVTTEVQADEGEGAGAGETEEQGG